MNPDPWFLRDPAPGSRARLFCIPYSGCGASLYRGWPRFVGEVEICPVQPPGRESRFAEPHFGTFAEFANQMAAALRPYLDVPFGFFGHCGSALPGYETSVRLAEQGGPLPRALFVSSQVAPQDGPYGRLLSLPDDELREEVRGLMRALGGEPIEDLLDLYLDVLRADLAANRAYRRAAVRLPIRITAIGWDRDHEVAPDLMGGWSACGDAGFVVLPGPHYQFIDPPAALLECIEAGLTPGADR